MKFLIKLTLITLFLTSSTIAEIVKIFEFTNEEFKELKVRKVKGETKWSFGSNENGNFIIEDISETKFSWLDYVDFQIFDSLLYVKDNNLVLDGNISIDIHNSSEIYKFFQTPRNYREEIKKITTYYMNT